MKPILRLLVSAFAASPFLAAGGPLIIAHRGASGVAPENTVAAFKEAFVQKADGFELDVRLTKDGRTLVIHDKSAKRTAGVDLLVAENDQAAFRKLDAGSWKNGKYKGEPIPDLAESLAVLPDGKTVYIEIKGDVEKSTGESKCDVAMLPELKRVIEASGKAKDQIVFICFDYNALAQARALMPGYKTLWLVSGKVDNVTKEKTYPAIPGLIEKVRKAGFDGLDLNHGFPLDKQSVAEIKAAGLELAVWTVNEPEVAKRLAEAGVDAITTDEPALIRAALK
jgi:glycerophosphoryl diester phosphodiesterase